MHHNICAILVAASCTNAALASVTFTRVERTCGATLGDQYGSVSESANFAAGTGERYSSISLTYGVNQFDVGHTSDVSADRIYFFGYVGTSLRDYSNGAFNIGVSSIYASFDIDSDQQYEAWGGITMFKSDGTTFRFEQQGTIPVGSYHIEESVKYSSRGFQLTFVPTPASLLPVLGLLFSVAQRKRSDVLSHQ